MNTFWLRLKKVGWLYALIIRLKAALITAPLTVSFGSASYPSHGNTSQLLVKAADRQLYHAKAIHYHRKENQDAS